MKRHILAGNKDSTQKKFLPYLFNLSLDQYDEKVIRSCTLKKSEKETYKK